MTATEFTATEFPERTLKAGETLYSQGDRGDSMVILVEGSLSVVEDGIELAFISTPGAFVGELAYLTRSARLAEVRAVTDTTVQVVEDIGAFFRDDPERAVEMSRLLAHRLREMDLKFIEIREQLRELDRSGKDVEEVPQELEFVRRYLKAWRVHV